MTAVYGPRLYFGPTESPSAVPLTTPTIKDDISMPEVPPLSRIEIEHNGLVVEWRIDDEDAMNEILSLVIKHVSPKAPPAPEKPYRPRRPKTAITPDLMVRVAVAYQEAPDGEKLKAVRNVLGDDASRQLAAVYVHRARKEGFLPPAAPRELAVR